MRVANLIFLILMSFISMNSLKAQSMDKKKASSNYTKGYKLVSVRKFRDAIEVLQKAIKFDSTGECGSGKIGMAYAELGYSYLRLGDYENALKYLNKAIDLNPFNPWPMANKANVYLFAKDKEEAIKILNETIRFFPDFYFSYAQRGFFFQGERKYELAIKDLTRYLELVEKQGQAETERMMMKGANDAIEDCKKELKK
jgi:tetratricopeptide (TPR) repeat protein